MGIADEVRARRFGSAVLSAQRIFTDRTTQKEAFQNKVAEVARTRSENPDLVLDLSRPRMNILAYYGQGGIGKTSLSLELERLFTGESKRGRTRRAIRIDFSDPSAQDPELYLLALRAGFGMLADSFPAFDTAFALYWARQNPGMPLAEFVRAQSGLGGVAQRQHLADNLNEFLQGIVDNAGLVIGGASRVVKLAWRSVQDVLVVRELRKDCPFFEACATEEDLDQLRLHLPLLLAWDLERIQRKSNVEACVFLDTFEHVTHKRRVARVGDLEDAVARSIYFLPNVVFVVTTRNRLDWASETRAPSLEYHGPTNWPGLAPETGPDQHRVGLLSQDDCSDYLAHCLIDEHGTPVISDPLRSEIARLSDGLPLYLDVAVNHFRSIVAKGSTPTADDFRGGLPHVVMRLMEDLDDDQSDLLRAASLFRVFDRRTLRAALPSLRSSVVEAFLDRSLVVAREDDLFSVHELLQTSVRLQDSYTSNPWSPEDWSDVASRTVAYWSNQFDDPASAIWRDRRTQTLAFWQLVGLYVTTDVPISNLADVIMQVQLRGVWPTIEAARDQPEPLLTPRGRELLDLLGGMMDRQIGNLQNTVASLEPLANGQGPMDHDLRRLALYYLGETYDLRSGNAAPLFRTLADTNDRIGTEATIALAHSRVRDGDLADALSLAGRFDPDSPDIEFNYRLHELLGHIWWCAGEFTRAADHFLATRRTAENGDSPLLLALARRHLCMVECWSNPTSTLAQIDEAEQLNRDLGLHPGVAQCQMSRATALVGRAPLDEVIGLLDAADRTFTAAGYLDDAIGPVAIKVFAAVATGDTALAIQYKGELYARAEGRRVRHWLAAADIWTDTGDHISHMTWPDGPDPAVAAWSAPLDVHRAGRQ